MIYLRDKPVRYRVPRQAIRDGIAYITEDRKVDGFFETMTVDQNIYLGFLSSPRVRRFFYSTREMKRVADRVDQVAVDLRAEAQSQDRRIFRRQPAEGRRREVPGAGTLDRHLRRADARRRRQRDPANSRRDSKARRREQGGGGDLVLSAGNPGHLGPHAGRARRTNRRGNVGGATQRKTRSCMPPFTERRGEDDDFRRTTARWAVATPNDGATSVGRYSGRRKTMGGCSARGSPTKSAAQFSAAKCGPECGSARNCWQRSSARAGSPCARR